MTHTHAGVNFPRPESGLRSADLIAHMQGPEHAETLAEQLDANDYNADCVSHDWLMDVHSLDHQAAEEADILTEAARIMSRLCARKATVHELDAYARRLRRMG
jgi:hypothetical protein